MFSHGLAEEGEKSIKGMRRKLGVNCQGDFIQLFLDDRLVGSVHDQTLWGWIGGDGSFR